MRRIYDERINGRPGRHKDRAGAAISPAEIEIAGETNVKKNYEAKAILRDEAHTWEVVIHSLYETIDEALLGAVRFLGHGYDVEAIYVNERNGTPVRVY